MHKAEYVHFIAVVFREFGKRYARQLIALTQPAATDSSAWRSTT